MFNSSDLYRRYHFCAEIIGFEVWLYNCFISSYSDIQKLLLYRGIEANYEVVRYWCRKFSHRFS